MYIFKYIFTFLLSLLGIYLPTLLINCYLSNHQRLSLNTTYFKWLNDPYHFVLIFTRFPLLCLQCCLTPLEGFYCHYASSQCWNCVTIVWQYLRLAYFCFRDCRRTPDVLMETFLVTTSRTSLSHLRNATRFVTKRVVLE